MRKTDRHIVPVFIAAFCLLCSGAAWGRNDTPETAQVSVEPSTAAVSGLSDDVMMPAVQLNNMPLGAAIEKMTASARVGLLMSADGDAVNRKITARLPRMPLSAALAIVLPGTGLDVSFANGVLIVRDMPATPVKDSLEAAVDASSETGTPDTDELPRPFQVVRDEMKEKWKEHWKNYKEDSQAGARSGRKGRVDIGGDISVSADEVVDEAVAIGGSADVAGRVRKDAVAIGGDLRVRSGARVEKDAVAVGGNVILEPGAFVGGDAVSVGGEVIVADEAEVKGDRVSVRVPLPPLKNLGGVLAASGTVFLVLLLVKSLFLLAVALLFGWLSPRRILLTRDVLTKRPGWSFLAGVLVVVGLIPLLFVLIATVIGIPLVPIVILLIATMGLFGTAVILYVIGQWIPLFRDDKGVVLSMLLGFVPFVLITVIPVVGGVFLLLAGIWGIGATLVSRFGSQT